MDRPRPATRREELIIKRRPGIESAPVECSKAERQFLERRLLLKGALSVGALGLLTGCNITNQERVRKTLWSISRWNDRVQAALFDPNRLAPTYPDSAITRPFPFNAFYDEDEAPVVEAEPYRLELSGLIRDRRPWSLRELNALPQTTQVTPRKSPVTFASKAGVPSASGAASHSGPFSNG